MHIKKEIDCAFASNESYLFDLDEEFETFEEQRICKFLFIRILRIKINNITNAHRVGKRVDDKQVGFRII